MRVEQQQKRLSAPAVLTAILNEFSAVTDYRTLRDSLPRRLASLLTCQYVLIYQRMGETLQFAAGTFDEQPGWSTSLLSVVQINPIDLNSDRPEARAWRLRGTATAPVENPDPTLVAVPLIYRQRAIGVLVAIRNENAAHAPTAGAAPATENIPETMPSNSWGQEEVQILEAVAGVVAMLLENTRLLEREQKRNHELSLLNSIGSQMNYATQDLERLRSIVIQRTKEIATVDLCELIVHSTPEEATPWIALTLRQALLRRINGQSGSKPAPLILERPGDAGSAEYFSHLATNIKTFFAFPLVSSGIASNRSGVTRTRGEEGPRVLGVIVGAYYRPWKLRHEENMMLQVLASQTSAALENMHLMTEVVEARNEARKLLRKVLDDQRMKELILESIPSGLITVDLQGRITTFNRAAAAMLGYHPYEMLGQPVQKILDLDGYLHMAYNALPAGRVKNEILVTLDRQGQEVVLDVTVLPLRNDRGEQMGLLATFNDVTSMRRLEEEKRRLDRLAALGRMAANVAHEVRNPLASIKITMQMLMDDLTKASPDVEKPCAGEVSASAQESVAVVLEEVERLDNIVRDLLLFAKPSQLHRVTCDLVKLNEHVLHVMQSHFTEAGVEVHRVYHTNTDQQEARVPPLQVDIAQVEQVLFNLYTNAVQAMLEGGVLTVSFQVVHAAAPDGSAEGAGSQPADSPQEQALPPSTAATDAPVRNVREASGTFEIQTVPAQEVYQQQHDWLEIAVSDTGVGIPPDQLELIFQPFFTTKAHGIGLGLPITQRLIEDHQGHIVVQSRLGYGATFSVRLPLSATQEEGHEGEEIRDGRETHL
ncbi:MAG: ATP-binding protein [Chloroflexota bacterium]|nr:ATP-binding protein [Chloroflexota bacterium]